MKVPFIDIKRYEPGFVDAVTAKFGEMVTNAQFMGGDEVSLLEQKLAPLMGAGFVVSCANGTDALQLALRALGVGRGDTVLVPDVTFWATFEAVVNVGATPATLDVDLADGGISVAALRQALADLSPTAVIIAHLYGWASAHLLDIRNICKQAGVHLIEDGAQCFGTLIDSRPVLEGALISTTSFYPAKVLGGAGDGGAVLTNDAGLAEKVRQLANHGRTSHYGYGEVGWNSRLDSLQAAFLNLSLGHFEARLASRRRSARYYRDTLPALGIQLMDAPAQYAENGYCNVCLFDDEQLRKRVQLRLSEEGIGFGNIYPGVISTQAGAAQYTRGHVGGTAGKKLCAGVLNLPLFAYMTDIELERVTAVVAQAMATA
ncbi:DegT/DnrJ/EryC1/StrS family aminotransferase [Devosia beringensis]|uniref:DegT/DnrJ/EryC1/StrS family aminotransferase n=1 Tax=Devosia beringensis TaxID=2657486 RepID=UPI00186B8A3C|nr:aminotransferase class I/II-fold pyridoxal phosphate-dependent enzyme [Devosia beringensis]